MMFIDKIIINKHLLQYINYILYIYYYYICIDFYIYIYIFFFLIIFS